MKRGAILALLTLTACAIAPSTPAYERCRTPMPLELRLKRIEERLARGYAHAPPLSVEEHKQMLGLAACAGAAALGSGDGCAREWAAARTSGLEARYRLRGAQYSVPEYVNRAIALPLGGSRTSDLMTAMLSAEEGRHQLFAHFQQSDLRRANDDSLQLMLVSADVQQAIICDAEDQARGRKTGLPFDPAASVPPGP